MLGAARARGTNNSVLKFGYLKTRSKPLSQPRPRPLEPTTMQLATTTMTPRWLMRTMTRTTRQERTWSGWQPSSAPTTRRWPAWEPKIPPQRCCARVWRRRGRGNVRVNLFFNRYRQHKGSRPGWKKQLEAARAKLQELRDRRTELDKEIDEQSNKADSCGSEVAKAQAELRELLERAKTEKGGDAQTTQTGAAGSTAHGTEGIAGAAAAWNAAKTAIEAQVTALPADLGKEIRDAIATQYAAMESLLNRIPTPTPPPPPPPQLHQQQHPRASQGGGTGNKPPTSTGTGADGGCADRGTTSDGRRDGAGDDSKTNDADDATTMLDVDDSVLEKLADIFCDQAANDANDGGEGSGSTDTGSDGGANSKSRKLREAQLAAARRCLNGPIPVRKTCTKNAGK